MSMPLSLRDQIHSKIYLHEITPIHAVTTAKENKDAHPDIKRRYDDCL